MRPTPGGLKATPTRVELVAVGASRGGLQVLGQLLAGLDRELAAAVVIVQHRLADREGRLVQLLDQHSPLPVSEPEDKEPIRLGHVYLAPANYHLLVEAGAFALNVDEPVQYARPSVDVLFESVADAFGPRACGVVLTGSNEDGAVGAARLQRAGARVIVQDPATALAPESPRAAIAKCNPDWILPPERIPEVLATLCGA